MVSVHDSQQQHVRLRGHTCLQASLPLPSTLPRLRCVLEAAGDGFASVLPFCIPDVDHVLGLLYSRERPERLWHRTHYALCHAESPMAIVSEAKPLGIYPVWLLTIWQASASESISKPITGRKSAANTCQVNLLESPDPDACQVVSTQSACMNCTHLPEMLTLPCSFYCH